MLLCAVHAAVQAAFDLVNVSLELILNWAAVEFAVEL